jgi:hypothetical protein
VLQVGAGDRRRVVDDPARVRGTAGGLSTTDVEASLKPSEAVKADPGPLLDAWSSRSIATGRHAQPSALHAVFPSSPTGPARGAPSDHPDSAFRVVACMREAVSILLARRYGDLRSTFPDNGDNAAARGG